MMMQLSADELFDVAIQMERNGTAFYRKAATLVSDESLRKELHLLANMEAEHEVTFSEMRQAFFGRETETKSPDPDSETVRYLESFTADNVFNMTDDASRAFAEGTSVRDILMFAIERERDSIAFFAGLKELVPKKLGRGIIDSIMLQEMGHAALLNGKLKEL